MGEERAQTFFEDVFSIAEYEPSGLLQIGPFRIRFHPTRHYIPCWACRIEVDGRALVYLADTGPSDDLAQFAASADVLICEATFSGDPPEGQSGMRGHLSAREAGALAAAAGVERLLLTHYWARLGADALQREAEDTFGRAAQLAVPGRTIVIA
jgi:ribonuclease BN (tRNA processing enzyme)